MHNFRFAPTEHNKRPEVIGIMPPHKARLGKQEPRYTFFLNPYEDVRFTSCPQCGRKMRQRKLPLNRKEAGNISGPPRYMAPETTCTRLATSDLAKV